MNSVTLRITGKNIDPAAISKELDLTPSLSWKAGERHLRLPQSKYRQESGSGRLFQSDELEGSTLNEQLEWWYELLRNRGDIFAKLVAAGAEAELNCFIACAPELSLILSHELIRKLAELHLDVTLDFSFT